MLKPEIKTIQYGEIAKIMKVIRECLKLRSKCCFGQST